MINALTRIFLSDASTTKLSASKVTPFPTDYFLRRVLLPELATLLIAEDLGIPPSDPKVRSTLEASRSFGLALFPNEEASVGLISSNRVHEKSALTSPEEQLILKQLPTCMVPCINSTFDPPAYGNCGYYAIAASIGDYSETSYLDVRCKLLAKILAHTEDHERLIYSAEARTTRSTRSTPTFGVEVVQELLVRLDCKDVKCKEEYWLRMPYLGYVIASAYNRPTILLDPRTSACNTFFPYRTLPNENNPDQDPIVLAFVNKIHFVSLGFKEVQSLPFPEVFGKHHNTAMLDSTKIPAWIKKYQHQLSMWMEQK